MSVRLFKRSHSVDGAKEEPSRKNATVVAKFYFSQVSGLFFKRKQKKLNGRGENRKCSPVRFHLCLGFPYLIYIEKETLFIFSLFHLGQLKLLV